MSKFNVFKPWTWFSSEERKKIVATNSPNIDYSIPKVGGESVTTPYRNIYFTGSSVVVILLDGTTVMRIGVDDKLVQELEKCTTEQQIRNLMNSTEAPGLVVDSRVETQGERQIVSDNFEVLRNHPDFQINGKQVFLKDVGLELPAVVAGSFIELLERMSSLEVAIENCSEQEGLKSRYEALKMFWYWTALNPIESARNDLFNFIRKNDINITSTGLLMMYRRVVSVASSKADKVYIKFITDNYLKLKKWKKSPKKFTVGQSKDGTYALYVNKKSKNWRTIGNLAKLYAELRNVQTERTYTDNHTKRKDIKIGAVYKEDEGKIDLDNTKDCSNGLHVGSRSFGFGGFGDVGVLCLVNPMYVRSVPVSETNKMRVSEMFVVGEMELKEYSENVESQEVLDFSEEYCQTTVTELEKVAKSRDFSKLACQNNDIAVPINNLKEIVKHIQNRVREVL